MRSHQARCRCEYRHPGRPHNTAAGCFCGCPEHRPTTTKLTPADALADLAHRRDNPTWPGYQLLQENA